MCLLLIRSIRCFAADSKAVVLLEQSDQARTTKDTKEMVGIYSFSDKYKPLRTFQILMSEKLAAEVTRVLKTVYINSFSVLVDEECLLKLRNFC